MYYISEDFRKLSEYCPPRRVVRTFMIISRNFPKIVNISEDFRGRSEDVSIVDQHLLARLTFIKGKHGS